MKKIVHGITMKTRSAEHRQNIGRICAAHVLPMFYACSFHGNSMNNLLSYCGLIDAKIKASDKKLPVFRQAASPNQKMGELNQDPPTLC